MMRRDSGVAFVLSVMIHLIALAVAVLFSIWKPAEKKREPVVMTLLPAVMPQAEPVAGLTPINFEELPPPVVEPVPQLPPRPEPMPKPEVKPEPEVKPKPEPKPKPEVKPKPEPKAEPPPEKMSYHQFQEKNPIRESPAPKPVPVARPVTAPTLDTASITRNLQSMMSREAAAQVSRQSASDQAALNSYFERIKSMVRGAWEKPPGLNDRLVVSISFQVSADGRISGVRIASSSGNAIFDQSVLKAFGQVPLAGRTPDGKSYPLRLEFRMTD